MEFPHLLLIFFSGDAENINKVSRPATIEKCLFTVRLSIVVLAGRNPRLLLAIWRCTFFLFSMISDDFTGSLDVASRAYD